MGVLASQSGLDPELIEKVLAHLTATGHTQVAPPVLQPANVFLDLIGEDIRRRLFLTTGADGADLCLRPDFTIPVCRQHVALNGSDQAASYCYCGPVFRQRTDELGEIPQLGAESLGRKDIADTDADMLALSSQALETLGVASRAITIGDEALFAAVLHNLDLPTVWRRRLRDLFGETDKLTAAIKRMSGETGEDENSRDVRLGFLNALEGTDPAAAHAVVEDLLSIAGIDPVGGRTASEIADRFLEQAALAKGAGGQAREAEILTAYLAIKADGAGAVDALKTFSSQFGMEIGSATDAFAARLQALEEKGISGSELTFSAAFGRRLDYYSGFVFEIHADANAAAGPLVGGGRYDKLVTLLGGGADMPAIGFSMWLDRIAASLGAR